MAIAWSSWSNAGNNGMRIGIETSVSNVSHGSSSVTVTWRIYTENRYRYSDNGQEIIYSGNKSGTKTYNNTQGAGSVTKRDEFTTSHSYGSLYGKSPGKHTVTARIGYTYNGSHPSKTVSVSLPARPFAGPTAPSGVKERRESDYRARISWTNNRTSGRPWDSVVVQRQELGGGWGTVATLSGSASSWTDTGIHADSSYRWRVYARNRVGRSGNVYTRTLWTTPATPKDVRTSLLSGNRVRIRWGSTVDYPSSEYTFDIERRDSNGTSWSRVIWGEPGSVRETIDSSPLAGENQYRVRTAHWEPGRADQQMQSDWVYAPVISTEVPPKAPTQLAPNGQVFDAADPIAVSWQHNSGGDGADQTGWEIRYTDGTTTWWIPGGGTHTESAASTYTLPAGTLTNGKTYQWYVRTWALHDDPGPYSAVATITAASSPTVTVTGPASPVQQFPPTATWAYTQPEGVAQTRAEVRVLSAAGGVLDTWVVNGASSSLLLDYPDFQSGETYTVEVRVRSGDGLWSDWAQGTFSVLLSPPADVQLVPTFDPESGAMVLALQADDPTEVGDIDRQNLAVNPSFESGLDQGAVRHATSLKATVALDDTWAAVGTHSIRIDPIPGKNEDTTFYPWGMDAAVAQSAIGLWPGTTVTIGATIHMDEPQTGELYYHARAIRVNVWDGETTTYGWALSDPAPNEAGDHRVSVTFTVPPEAAGVHINLCNGSQSGPVWWDAVTVEHAATDGSYFDGDSPEGHWLGVPHESTSVTIVPGTGLPPGEGTSEVDHVDVQRRIDGGEWVTLHSSLSVPEGTAVLDTAPTLKGLNEYRLIVTSVAPSQAVTAPVPMELYGYRSTRWAFLSYGDGFTTVLRGQGNPALSQQTGRVRATVPVLGRADPLLLIGGQKQRTHQVSLRLLSDDIAGTDGPSSSGREFLTAGRDAGVVLWRDWTGARIFGRLSDVDVTHHRDHDDSVSFSVEQSAHDEDVS